MVVAGESLDSIWPQGFKYVVQTLAEGFNIQLVMHNANSNSAASAATSLGGSQIGADSFIIGTRIELLKIADRFAEWERRMGESKEGLMDGRLDNEIRTMNVAFYQLDEALKKILGKELEFDILRYDKTAE